jgi:wyosine [tRNA(Phe)-imidazoG37] synthetase (radical SAM superfamily)
MHYKPQEEIATRPLVFGPKRSRRLGHSLAVDVVHRKTCPLDCVYCELGRTDHLTLERREYVSVETVLEELRTVLRNGADGIDHITLSASGEPTLNSKLGEIIRRIKEMTTIPVAILTNGVLLFREDVRRDLLQADIVLPSLDAASDHVFEAVNRPHGRLDLEEIIDGLVTFRREFLGQIWLEILLVKGINDTLEELALLKTAVDRIRPDVIHLNTVVRPPAESWARRVEVEELRKIRRYFGPICRVA